MAKRDELFTLIKSMNTSEKGYFKKFSRLHGTEKDNKYLRLFNCISNMTEYDETRIRKEFKGEKVLNQLGVAKHYLKHLIIRALRNYYEDRIPFVGRMTAMADSFVMIHKLMPETAFTKITKATELAIEEENFPEVMLNSVCMEALVNRFGHRNEAELLGTNMLETRIKAAEQYQNISEYSYLGAKVRLFDISEAPDKTSKALEMLAHPLLNSDAMPDSAKALLLYTQMSARLYSLTEQPDKARQLVKKTIAQFDPQKPRLRTKPYNLALMHYLLRTLIDRNNIEERIITNAGLKQFVTENNGNMKPQELLTLQSLIEAEEISCKLFLGHAEKALVQIVRHEKIIAQMADNGESSLSNFFQEAYAYLQLNQFTKALEKVNHIIHGDFGMYEFMIIPRQIALARNMAKKRTYDIDKSKPILQNFKRIGAAMAQKNRAQIRKAAREFLDAVNASNTTSTENYLEFWLERKLREK
jgi:hypothetical protein